MRFVKCMVCKKPLNKSEKEDYECTGEPLCENCFKTKTDDEIISVVED